jgi:hypothetical protein
MCTDLELLEFSNIFKVILTKLKNNQILLKKLANDF